MSNNSAKKLEISERKYEHYELKQKLQQQHCSRLNQAGKVKRGITSGKYGKYEPEPKILLNRIIFFINNLRVSRHKAQQIRQRTDSDLTALEASVSSQDVPAGKEDSVEGLREVIKYLRREKEIVDIKYELLQQENRRLKQQLDRTTSDLDETRVLTHV